MAKAQEQVQETPVAKVQSVFADFDVATRTITFKLATGEVLTRTIPEEEVANLTDLQITKILYGEREKIKTTLAPIALVPTEADRAAGKISKAEKIALEIKALEEGKFVIRSAASQEVDDFTLAFALVAATGKINTGAGEFNVPQAMWPTEELHPEWLDVKNVQVIASVKAYWDALDKKVKASLRRNSFITTQESYIVSGDLVL